MENKNTVSKFHVILTASPSPGQWMTIRQQRSKKAREIVLRAEESLASKTDEMNLLLSNGIPQFRCSDPKFEDIYYFLWSIYLMYYIDVQKGWEMENHTQSAVNNFLGIHRYDACFQIKVGAWARDKKKFAYGNV